MSSSRKTRRSEKRKWLRIAICAIFTGLLFYFALMQSQRVAAGFIHEKQVMGQFRTLVAGGTEPDAAAKMSVSAALLAFVSEPLIPDALTIIALGQDEAERAPYFFAIGKMNRREELVLASQLVHSARLGDFDNFVDSFDRLMRVEPELKAQFLPLLLPAIQEDSSLSSFQRMLADEPEWGADFLILAAGDQAALSNAVKLRLGLRWREGVPQNVDQAILNALGNRGDLGAALEYYSAISAEKNLSNPASSTSPLPSTSPSSDPGRSNQNAQSDIDWTTQYPPIDWELADEAQRRAEIIDDAEGGKAMEIYVRDGFRGILGSRIFKADGDFRLLVDHQFDGPKSDVLQAIIRCGANGNVLLDYQFSGNPAISDRVVVPPNCPYLQIELQARPPYGYGNIRGTICRIRRIDPASDLAGYSPSC